MPNACSTSKKSANRWPASPSSVAMQRFKVLVKDCEVHAEHIDEDD
jgi:hypothetical protein